MLRILILSDIHMLSLAEERDPNYTLRKRLISDIKDYRKTNGNIDHILISGDIAFKGDCNEYSKADSFLKRIANVSGCETSEIYMVPGNHDKDFSASNPDMRHILDEGLGHDRADDLFCSLLDNDFENAKKLLQPFKNYHDFSVSYDSFEPIMVKGLETHNNSRYNPDKDKFFMKRNLKKINDFQVCLYGVNSALTSDRHDINDDGNGHKLFLSTLAYNPDVEDSGTINILMMHHPTGQLVQGDEIQKKINEKFHIQIFGHLHKSASYNDNSVHILSGALQPPINNEEDKKWYFSVYNIVELEVKEQSRGISSLEINLMVEKYNGSNFEHDETASQTFKINLTKSSDNRWAKGGNSSLPNGVTVRKVRIAFLQSGNPIKFIKDFQKYDKNKSEHENCISFLQQMEAENRLNELWKKLNQ